MMNDKDKKQLSSANIPNSARAMQGKLPDEEGTQDEGQELCPKCGNLMIEEGGKKTCSSCSDEIDFFGENDDESEDKVKNK